MDVFYEQFVGCSCVAYSMKAIPFGMLSPQEQTLYDGILHACKQRDFQELKRYVSQFTRNGRSMRDVYFKTQYDDCSHVPSVVYAQLRGLLLIGCHYTVTPLSILCVPSEMSHTENIQNTLEMITYLLENHADPNISILLYLPVPKRNRRNSRTTMEFPFALEDFNYDFAKVMYYQTLLSLTNTNDSVDSVDSVNAENHILERVLLSYGASYDIPK